jgi:hypothetical protein
MQGDLGILGKIPTKLFYERQIEKTPQFSSFCTVEDIISLKEDSAYIITCGDSFSQLGENGYQNYLSQKGCHVINFFPHGAYRGNPFQSALDLMSVGGIDSTNTKIIIVESVERALLSRLLNIEYNNYFKKNSDNVVSKSEVKWSLTDARNYLFFNLGLEESPVIKFRLKEEMFMGTHGKELYIYHDDLNSFSIPDSVNQIIKTNVEKLFDEAVSKGIRLIVLVCPDKYDIYQEYIIDNPYPIKTMNEDFRKIVGNRVDIVIGKEILLPHVHAGVKDMYYLDDTHWSYKSAKIIADTLFTLCNFHPCCE